MSAALKSVPRRPQNPPSMPNQVERLAPRTTPQELRPAETGQLTRFPSRTELVQRRRSSGVPANRGATPKSLARPTASVRSLPNKQKLPNWLKLLLGLQQASGPIAFTLVTAALVAYGWTVHTQHIWSSNFQQLERLQQKERTLTAFGQMMNHQIARQAESPEANLSMPGPQNTLFLEPPTPLPTSVTPAPVTTPVVTPVELKAPMGY